MKKFEFLGHMADIKIRVYGSSVEEIFENSVMALCRYVSRRNKIKDNIKKKIKVSGTDKENLFLNFLNEIIYLFDAGHFITSRAKIKIKGNKLESDLYGDKTSNYKGLDHIKAATYHEMYIQLRKDKVWEAQFVVDV